MYIYSGSCYRKITNVAYDIAELSVTVQSIEGSSCGRIEDFMDENINSELGEWASFFKDRGLRKEVSDAYLEYIRPIEEKGFPVIFEIHHLANLLGLEYSVVNAMIYSPYSFYRKFSIPKRRGGTREISSPYPSLLECQRWIKENILDRDFVHYSAQAYTKSKSILSNASKHLDNHALLKIDVKDFFPSIKINWVVSYFHSLGYAKNVSFALASLCCLNGELPQGAATSPSLSNILCRSLDKRLYRLAKAYELTYTRYADDIAISGRYIPNKLITDIRHILHDYGFILNDKKTNLIIGNKQKIVTGIAVHGDKLALPRKYKRRLKQEIHFISTYGLISHISKKKIRDPHYLESLKGKVKFWLQVEPTNHFALNALKTLQSY